VPAPRIPDDEPSRLEALRALDVLDTPAEERFDRLTRLARRLFDVPIALVSLVDQDRQWFKSRAGLDATETPRDVSFCGHTILDDRPLVVPNALDDARFADSPLVLAEPNVRFYVGWPLKAPNGQRIGALCLMDRRPRPFEDDDLEALRDLAAMVEHELAAVQLATRDALTGVPNRRGFELLADQSLRVCRRQRLPMALVYIDLDGFKAINDAHGHAEGDRALARFGHLLGTSARDTDVVGRIGGDEFALLLVDATPNQADLMAARIQEAVDALDRGVDRPYGLAFSHGVVAFDPDRHRSIGDLLSASDERMYERKRSKD
jgi:diguanylate cyclase (GGDEF)-like protein